MTIKHGADHEAIAAVTVIYDNYSDERGVTFNKLTGQEDSPAPRARRKIAPGPPRAWKEEPASIFMRPGLTLLLYRLRSGPRLVARTVREW